MMYDDELDVPEFMNKPRRERKEIREIETPYGKVSNIEQSTIAKAKKRKIRRRRPDAPMLIASFALGAVLTFGGMKAVNALTPADSQPSIPSGYILTEVTDRIEPGDTITGIASEYYNANTYSGMYPTSSDYTSAILEQNGLHDYSTIHPGDRITVPVVVDENNSYYVRIQALKDAIKTIESENLWVQYQLKGGEGTLDVAAKASGSVNETYQFAEIIAAKNKGARWWTGDTVWIMNPELGSLKTELHELEQALQESLKVEGEKTY